VTLVVAQISLSHPVLIGDLLVSRRRPGKGAIMSTLNTPTMHDINAQLPSTTDMVISGVARKLAILGGRLAIGFAGSVVAAKAVASDLRTLVDRGDFQKSDLDEFLAKLGPDYLGKQELSLCGLLVDGNRTTLFGWDATQITSKMAETAFVCGSGAEEFAHLIDAISMRDSAENQKLNPIAASLTSVMGTTAVMLGEQMRVSKSIDAFFGGGFEIITPYDGMMHAMPVTYAFLEVHMDKEKGMTITFHRMLGFDYFGEVLIVHSLWPDALSPKKDIFILSPLDRKVTEPELAQIRAHHYSWPSANLTCAYVHLPQAEPQRRVWVQCHFTKTQDQAVRVIETSEGTEVQLSVELQQRMWTHAAQVCGL
jgi:hypothetical protein